jgi:integrase/recombinase XerD
MTEEEKRKELESLEQQAKELRKQLPRKFKRKILPQALSDDEFKKVIELIQDRKANKKIKVAFLLAYESGLRISEILSLQKEDINAIAKTIFVRKGKFSKDRVVPLPKTWKSYMIDLIPLKYKNIKSGSRSLELVFKRCIIQLGLNPHLHFHNLRHSFATHCLERGMPINQLQILLGHSNISITNVYIQANPKDALASYERVF